MLILNYSLSSPWFWNTFKFLSLWNLDFISQIFKIIEQGVFKCKKIPSREEQSKAERCSLPGCLTTQKYQLLTLYLFRSQRDLTHTFDFGTKSTIVYFIIFDSFIHNSLREDTSRIVLQELRRKKQEEKYNQKQIKHCSNTFLLSKDRGCIFQTIAF